MNSRATLDEGVVTQDMRDEVSDWLAGHGALATDESIADLCHRVLHAARPLSASGDTKELVRRLRAHGTVLYPPDHPTTLLLWEAATALEGRS